ncbi:PREDICTED: testis-specific serine/threonine-protein kinase 5-like [Galeopterus variegatus]|uniref:non-specific serine/threonine protein kinase n=1 Tax=Galeopterus variegatus TaxID=482537 RepID=A0ABM0QNI9_GALVR|nr:PREDICTED: testis-specific serine/threonine-protein kinase 5-like [Galeopterus variegatus]
MKGSGRHKLDQRTFMEQVRECRDKGYLLSSKKIGSGAFSKVYLAYATHERMQHNPKLSSDLRGKHHTMSNGRWVGVRQVQLYETYQNSQRSYLVLELAARGDLLEHINNMSDRRCCPGLEEEEARRLFWQLVSAVAHCHGAGIVHRDLKCENILLDDRGFLKLTDFGFANRTRLKDALLSTFCGSMAYTAPEILMSKKYSGQQADLWSLGVILYAMVTGKLPFKECQPRRMLHLMRRGPTFRLGLSPECQDLIRGLLQLRPRTRLGLQQVAVHCWMLPAAHVLFHTVLSATPEKWADSQLPASPDHAEPSADLESPRPILQLQCPQRQGTTKGRTLDTELKPPEAHHKREVGSVGSGLYTAAASAGTGACRQLLSLCCASAIRNMPGHYLINREQVGRKGQVR